MVFARPEVILTAQAATGADRRRRGPRTNKGGLF
jgi:hypothetical protein